MREVDFLARTVARRLLWILNGVGDPQPLAGSASRPTTFQNETGLTPALAWGRGAWAVGDNRSFVACWRNRAIGWANRECHRSYCLIKTLTGVNDHF